MPHCAATLPPTVCVPFRDVAQVAGEGGRALQRNPRYGELDRKFTAVGTYRRHFDAPSEDFLLSRGHVTGQPPLVLIPQCRRDYHIDQRLAHHLVPTVAEGALRGPIELSDATLVT